MAKYDPSKDIVAGRTAKQIEAAKRRAVKGGGRKKCKKGKSCGATCINSSKVCLVDLPWVSSNGLSKVSKKIQDASGKKPKAEPAPKPLPPKPKAPLLSPMETYDEMRQKVKDTYEVTLNPKLTADSIEVARILDKKNTSFPSGSLYGPGEKDLYDSIRNGIGVNFLADGSYVLDRFTASYDRSYAIRQADRGALAYKNYKGDADALDKLLNRKELPKTEVEKFRGFRASPETLQEMIDGAKNKETFVNKSVNSWSSALRIGQRFADREILERPERTQHVIFRTINKRGVPIEFVTSVTNEDEILTPRNTSYKYLGYRALTSPNGKTYHVFDVEEFS
jgi:hypothetical protein